MMTDLERENHAKRLITENCLIAADVDRTILVQIEDRGKEQQEFFRHLANDLVETARLGSRVAFITGNSMHELCHRILLSLISVLASTHELPLISQFHFFCNSGGVYFHFPPDVVQGSENEADLLQALVSTPPNGDWCVRPEFVHEGYLGRTLVEPADIEVIKRILGDAAERYVAQLESGESEYDSQYDLSGVKDSGHFVKPRSEVRQIEYRSGNSYRTAAVQVTLKPVLSFRHAKRGWESRLLGNDVRTTVSRWIQASLDREGLGKYVARPGGRTSIDITLQRLDKAYALEFLIDYLRVEGDPRRGQRFGSNTIYFGDEVIVGGGNDYPVTRIPGLMVFAVNPDKELVPFLSHVFVPSAFFAGPNATREVLVQYNTCARQLIAQFCAGQPVVMTAIEDLKYQLFTSRIEKKLADLKRDGSVPLDDWQTLHTFVTLMSRDDPAARYWSSLLVNELDGIMAQIRTTTSTAAIPGQGTSHP